jgi:glycosyltransferase involved in cell wall biosynthesis
MRILTVSNCPALEHLGSGYVIANFARGLRALGHCVDLLQPDDYEVCQSLRPRANSYRQAVGMLLAVKRALRMQSYDMVEFWGGEAWPATRWLVGSESGRPMVVQHTNGPEPRYNRMLQEAGVLKLTALQSWHAEKLVPHAFHSPDAIVTVSEYDRLWLTEHDLPQSGRRKAIEVPLPDCLLGRPPKARASRVIGFCGTWLAKKGIAIIIPDITRLLREFTEWRFLVLGTNSDDQVRSFFSSDIRPRVEVLPMIRDKETLARQYERMEIFVLPSFIESFGVALAEAMACGCAAVITRVGLGASLVDGEHALLLEKAESPHLYESVKRLVLNPGLRQRLGAAAWERVQGLRWDSAVQDLSDTYERWLDDYRCAV